MSLLLLSQLFTRLHSSLSKSQGVPFRPATHDSQHDLHDAISSHNSGIDSIEYLPIGQKSMDKCFLKYFLKFFSRTGKIVHLFLNYPVLRTIKLQASSKTQFTAKYAYKISYENILFNNRREKSPFLSTRHFCFKPLRFNDLLNRSLLYEGRSFNAYNS